MAKGYSQKEGINYKEISSPVVKHVSIRLLLSIVAQLDLELEQLDVKTTFLHGNLEEHILMSQLEGYAVESSEEQVCLLNRSLYGLKQSPRQWKLRFDTFMIQSGFTRSGYDNCVYLTESEKDNFTYLLLYVDDMLIASNDMTQIHNFKTLLSSEFERKIWEKLRRS